jgi:hypothetical protein
MRGLFRTLSWASASLLLVSLAAAQVGSALCLTCGDEQQCELEYYPCGQNEDGTVIWCVQTNCVTVEVCEYEPCEGGLFTFDPIESFESLPPLESFPSF